MQHATTPATPIAAAAALACCLGGLWFSPAAHAQAAPHAATAAPMVSANFSGQQVAPTATLIFEFAAPAAGAVAVMVGTEDMSAQFAWVSPARLEGVFAAMPLPVGTHVVKLFAVGEGGAWRELAQLELVVQTSPGAPGAPDASAGGAAQASAFKPSLVLGLKSQLAERHSAGGSAPPRPTYADLTTQLGLQTEHGEPPDAAGQGGWSLTSQLNAVGSSHHPEAVDFGQRGALAPKLDLASYLVELKTNSSFGQSTAQLGHIQAGNHPMLANSIGHRGLQLLHQFGPRWDAALAVQNGNASVGSLNITGLSNPQHRWNTLSTGVEVLERAGALRLEATAFEGQVLPKPSVGVANWMDAERSQGWGLKLKAQSESGGTRFETALARSTHTPKGDSTLSILPGPASRAQVWFADVTQELLKNHTLAADWPLNLTVQARHERAERGYKSLGAGQAGDYAASSASLQATLGLVSSQLQLTTRHDNLDGSAAFLKNESRGLAWSLNLPLPQLISATEPPKWAPSVSYSLGRNSNAADTAFIPLGQTLANLPKLTAINHSLGLNWALGKLSVAYQLAMSAQDNQQLGLERMDNTERSHTLNLTYPVTEQLNLTSGFGQRRSLAKDTGLMRLGANAQLGMSWTFGDRYALAANLATSRDQDRPLTSSSSSVQAGIELSKPFEFTGLGLKLPGQWSLRYASSTSRALGTVPVRFQTLNFNLSLTLF